jgi:hypothetical protein
MGSGTEPAITQADANGLSEKLKTFVGTLTPGEKDALKMALAPSAVAEGDDVGGFASGYDLSTPFGVLRVDSQRYKVSVWGQDTVQSLRAR